MDPQYLTYEHFHGQKYELKSDTGNSTQIYRKFNMESTNNILYYDCLRFN